MSDAEEPVANPGTVVLLQAAKKRRSYAASEKVAVMDYANQFSRRQAARDFNVDNNTVRDWFKKEAEIRAQAAAGGKVAKRARVDGAGRKLKDEDFDNALFAWIEEQMNRKIRISRRLIFERAEQLLSHDEDGNALLKLSRGWLDFFLKRHGLTQRRTTTVAQKPPAEYAEVLVKFVLYVARMRKERDYTHVCVLTTGHEKARVTVILTARSTGFKMKPFVLLPLKRPVPLVVQTFGHRLNLIWAGAGNSWMNNEFTERYLGMTFGAHNFSQARKLLIWDSFRCHLSDTTKAVCRKIGIETATVPGGCTKFIQAPDVSWNAPFKAHVRRSYDKWMAACERATTAGGNPKPPSMLVYLKWVTEAWDSLPSALIAHSFKTCGMTIALDGSEDAEIHCFKPTGPVPEGFEMLKQKRQEDAADAMAQLIEEIDLAEDEQNGYESDDSVEL